MIATKIESMIIFSFVNPFMIPIAIISIYSNLIVYRHLVHKKKWIISHSISSVLLFPLNLTLIGIGTAQICTIIFAWKCMQDLTSCCILAILIILLDTFCYFRDNVRKTIIEKCSKTKSKQNADVTEENQDEANTDNVNVNVAGNVDNMDDEQQEHEIVALEEDEQAPQNSDNDGEDEDNEEEQKFKDEEDENSLEEEEHQEDGEERNENEDD